MAINPCQRFSKIEIHESHCKAIKTGNYRNILIGDSIIAGFDRYQSVWAKYFQSALNFGIRGDRVEHVLWRANSLPHVSSIENVFILCGTNNLSTHDPEDIADGIIDIGCLFKN